jgi:hypothetical protein
MPNRVRLYVDGFNFYFGATEDHVENGWSNLLRLGNFLAEKHFGHSYKVRQQDITYVTSPVTARMAKRYEESKRYDIWINRLRKELPRINILEGVNNGAFGKRKVR